MMKDTCSFKHIVKFVVIFDGIMVAIRCNFMREFDDFSKFLPHFALPDSIFFKHMMIPKQFVDVVVKRCVEEDTLWSSPIPLQLLGLKCISPR